MHRGRTPKPHPLRNPQPAKKNSTMSSTRSPDLRKIDHHVIVLRNPGVHGFILVNGIPLLQWSSSSIPDFRLIDDDALTRLPLWIREGDNTIEAFLWWASDVPYTPYIEGAKSRFELNITEDYETLHGQESYPRTLLSWPHPPSGMTGPETMEFYPAYLAKTFQVRHAMSTMLWREAEPLEWSEDLERKALAFMAELYRMIQGRDIDGILRLKMYSLREASYVLQRLYGMDDPWGKLVREQRDIWLLNLTLSGPYRVNQDLSGLRIALVGEHKILQVTRSGGGLAMQITYESPVLRTHALFNAMRRDRGLPEQPLSATEKLLHANRDTDPPKPSLEEYPIYLAQIQGTLTWVR